MSANRYEVIVTDLIYQPSPKVEERVAYQGEVIDWLPPSVAQRLVKNGYLRPAADDADKQAEGGDV